ncbi:MAG: class II fumarate hydratase [Planctomycetota bacterium]
MTTPPAEPTRTEKDSMGEMQVPESVLYGASTQRAVLNFPMSGRPVPAQIIRAFAMLKSACAQTNARLGLLDQDRADAITSACASIESGLEEHGGLDRNFPVDVYQTGSGTSTNMNANEVIANLVCLARGEAIGRSKDAAYIEKGGVHPNDHANMGQSSNDTFPTAMHVAAAIAIKEDLLPALDLIGTELEAKARAWDDVIKIGRTHLQDATPIRLGQEFSGYAAQIHHAKERLHRSLHVLGELAIGGTAVGTGINTHPEFGALVAASLTESTGVHFREAANHFEAQHAKDGYVEVSGDLKAIAVSISKIAGDIRLMGCGPRCGIGELKLPAVQPGSSIMPGKVNPVICESAVMACCRVIGNDAALTVGGLGGVGSLLDLNVAMPMMADALLESITLMAATCRMMSDHLILDLEPDRERCAELIEGSLAMCTSLAPVIGYDKAAALAKTAFDSGKTVREVAREMQVLDDAELDRLLDPRAMTEPSA